MQARVVLLHCAMKLNANSDDVLSERFDFYLYNGNKDKKARLLNINIVIFHNLM